MLNITFACGASTRVPYNPDATVADVLDQVRGHEKAAEAAPGRERAYLSAAVNSTALAALRDGAGADQVEESAGAAAAAKEPADEPSAKSSGPKQPSAVLVGKAFLADAPFPPLQLQPAATLEACKIEAEGRMYVTFVAPQELVDPTKAAGLLNMPKRYIVCSKLATPVARSAVVWCDGSCGRNGGPVIGGANQVYRVTSSLCLSAVHAGALDKTLPGAFTVEYREEVVRFMPSGNDTKGIPSQGSFDDEIKTMHLRPYEAGDEDVVGQE